MEIPPEDSIFSLPIWKKGFRDPEASKVQLNPQSAMSQNGSKVRTQQIVAGVSMLAILLVVVVGGIFSSRQKQTVNVQASLNLKKALQGKILEVNTKNNTIVLSFSSSLDPVIHSLHISTWSVQLPPGISLTKQEKEHICYSIDSISGNPDAAKPGICQLLLRPGREILVEYVVLKKETSFLIAKKIIVQIQ